MKLKQISLFITATLTLTTPLLYGMKRKNILQPEEIKRMRSETKSGQEKSTAKKLLNLIECNRLDAIVTLFPQINKISRINDPLDNNGNNELDYLLTALDSYLGAIKQDPSKSNDGTKPWELIEFLINLINNGARTTKKESLQALTRLWPKICFDYILVNSSDQRFFYSNAPKMVTLLVDMGLDINTPLDDSGQSLLHQATVLEYAALVKFLIALGADANCKDAYQFSPVNYATHSFGNFYEILQVLLKNGGDIHNMRGPNTLPLHSLIEFSYPLKTIELALQYGADVNAPNNLKESPLKMALKAKKYEIAKLLFAYGANIDKEVADDNTMAEFFKDMNLIDSNPFNYLASKKHALHMKERKFEPALLFLRLCARMDIKSLICLYHNCSQHSTENLWSDIMDDETLKKYPKTPTLQEFRTLICEKVIHNPKLIQQYIAAIVYDRKLVMETYCNLTTLQKRTTTFKEILTAVSKKDFTRPLLSQRGTSLHNLHFSYQ